MHRAPPYDYRSKRSSTDIRPINLPKLHKPSSRNSIIDISQELRKVRESLAPLLQLNYLEQAIIDNGSLNKPRKRRRRTTAKLSSSLLSSVGGASEGTHQQCPESRVTEHQSEEYYLKPQQTQSTQLNNTLNSFERLINKNRDIIRTVKKLQQGEKKRQKSSANKNHKTEEVPADRVEQKLIANKSTLFDNINTILDVRQKTESLKSQKYNSSIIQPKRHTVKTLVRHKLESCKPINTQTKSPKNTEPKQQTDRMQWRRVSLNTKHEIQMIDSTFQDQVNKINRYGEKTEHSLQSYVRNLETLMVLKLNDQLKVKNRKKADS